jgi:hypothetical protein
MSRGDAMVKYNRERWEIYEVNMPRGYIKMYIAVEKGISLDIVCQDHHKPSKILVQSPYVDDLIDFEYKHTLRTVCHSCGNDCAYYMHGEGICDKKGE